jgi:hypothetical protein
MYGLKPVPFKPVPYPSVSEWFAGFQGEGYALLGFALSTERQECLTLEVEEILLGDDGSARDGTST